MRGQHAIRWSNDEAMIDGSSTCFILECCGCETMFFRRDEYFSEDAFHYQDEFGELQVDLAIKTTYWPAPTKREEPSWLLDVELSDRSLGNILSELYAALNNDLRVLAAIGARTSFDRASELLGVDSRLPFDQKLDRLVELGKVGKEERDTLDVLVDAGSAAAHRAWMPSSDEVTTIMEIVEAFLHRSFVLGDNLSKLKAGVPPKPARSKKPK
ncbi:MAG: DUF4145 domain-containing protein [Methylocystis sp.]|uniref:DUF4145 domain-containing protein n=1 Tax=Methylocystis sp. TaxID=1911079 RepID=UPI003DA40CFE